ncbi:MAG: VWA domain-containing protein [Elusimicrobiota bacterium]
MHFHYPGYLILLVLIPILVIFYVYVNRNRKKMLNLFASTTMLSRLVNYAVTERFIIKAVLLTTTTFFLIFSLAGPQIGSRLVNIKRHGVDIIIAIDCSTSMLAEDIAPNRMRKAKDNLSMFVNQLQGDRIGIIAFSGTAFMQCPLTLDYNAAKMLLSLIDPSLIPRAGTSIGEAIQLATKSFSQKERKYKVLVLLTDGEDHQGDPLAAAEAAKREGVKIYTIGFGNPEGEVIPIRDTAGNLLEYKKDKSGSTVVSKLDETTLQKIAMLTGGKYYRATGGDIEVQRIYDDISSMEKKELQSKLFSKYEDRYQYFLGIALLLLLLELILPETKPEKKEANV